MRTVKEKSDTQTTGPWKFLEYSENKSNVIIFNPWVGESSKFEVHQNDLIVFPGKLPFPYRILDPKEDINWLNHGKQGQNAVKRAAKFLKKKPEDLTYIDLCGHRIKVKWSGVKGVKATWYFGTIVDYSPLLKQHYIKYDIADEEGDRFYPQNIIGTNAPNNWKLLRPEDET